MSKFRRRLMMMQKIKHNLPKGYNELQYITSEKNKNSYFKTSIRNSDIISLELDIKFNYIGTRQLMGLNGFWLGINNIGNYDTIGHYWSNTKPNPNLGTSRHLLVAVKINDIIKILLDKKEIIVSALRPNPDLEAYMFAINFNQKCFCYCSLYSAKIICKDSKNSKYYIPCISPNQEVGMYDLVENKFYKSETNTPFIAGPII